MLSPTPFIPARPRKRRKRRAVGPNQEPLPAEPVLVAVEYEVAAWVRLTFDRPVNAPAMLPGDTLIVDDGPNTSRTWNGAAVTMLGPAQIEVALEEGVPSGSPATTLTATAATGIVSQEDATPWPGVTQWPLA